MVYLVANLLIGIFQLHPWSGMGKQRNETTNVWVLTRCPLTAIMLLDATPQHPVTWDWSSARWSKSFPYWRAASTFPSLPASSSSSPSPSSAGRPSASPRHTRFDIAYTQDWPFEFRYVLGCPQFVWLFKN